MNYIEDKRAGFSATGQLKVKIQLYIIIYIGHRHRVRLQLDASRAARVSVLDLPKAALPEEAREKIVGRHLPARRLPQGGRGSGGPPPAVQVERLRLESNQPVHNQVVVLPRLPPPGKRGLLRPEQRQTEEAGARPAGDGQAVVPSVLRKPRERVI